MKQKKNSKEVAVNWDLWYHVVSDVLDGYYKTHPYDKYVWLSNISHKCKLAMAELGMANQVVGKHVLGLASCIEEYLGVQGYDMVMEKKSGAYRYHGRKAGAVTPAQPVAPQLDQNKELASDIRATLERVADLEVAVAIIKGQLNDIKEALGPMSREVRRTNKALLAVGCQLTSLLS